MKWVGVPIGFGEGDFGSASPHSATAGDFASGIPHSATAGALATTGK